MDYVKIIGVAFITAVSAIVLKSNKPELSFAVTVTGIIVILLFIIEGMRGALSIFSSIAEITGMENGLLKVLIKIVGVGYLTEFTAGILQDFGSSSLADKVVLGGKIAIITLAFPVFEILLSLIKGFLQLL